ncbi:sulfate/molybdate ABC transporter ATP-binding protein [Piscinibacter sp.]|uniref:sulfate/molybdate ABC transporter ATP-binding protein n=1 Tax=Piscinibacter sp. TaxID=1903157 RepID=UPI0039E66792
MSGGAVWDVALRKQLRHGASRFTLDLQFRCDAQRVVLYGPSGSGKTQTLRMIGGIVTPDDGRVCVAGRVLFDRAAGVSLSPQARRLAFVFQDYALFPHLTVRQNIAFGLRRGWRNPTRAASDPAAERWIEQFQLQGVAGHYPHQISGGQRQRTALARALVNQPTALLLDEPFAALDKGLRQRLREELLELQVSLQLPLLLITHDDDDVRSLAQQVVQIEEGRAGSTA